MLFPSSAFGTNTQSQPNTLFGSSQTRPGGFGATNTSTSNSGGMFGGTQTAGATGGFGSGGFGNSGATGGFGANANANTSNTGGSLFGAAKPAGFGTSATGTGGFGASAGGFGSAGSTPAPTGGFGGSGNAFGAPAGGVPPCEGTGGTPFNAFTEKDASASATNHYQSICFQQPYSKFSFEELRLADYQQGRRFGNGSGQAGAFGSSAFGNTGGFGAQQNNTSTTGGFGSNTTPFGGASTSAPSGFGATQTAGAFGSTNSNSMFGAAKPAGNTLFGGGTGATPAPSTGSIFGGSTPAAGGAFGNNAAAGTGGAFGNTGGSLFGGNNQQQNKPAFGASNTTGGGFGFGGNTQSTGAANPFGGSTTTTASPFGGGAAPQQNTGGAFGGFGNTSQQNQQPAQSKPLFGGGTFGSGTQQGTGTGLLGGGTGTAPAAGTSLFGNNTQQPQQGGGMFGGGQPQQAGAGNSLFGGTQNQQAKPAGGLFGSTPAPATGGFSGFGSSTTQPATGGGGLFGGSQNQTQQKPGGFGGFGSTANTGGTGMFGNSQNTTGQNAGASLFGGGQTQQPQTGGSSMFGNSQPGQQSQPAPGSFQASLLDGNPYGSQSIFSGLPAPGGSTPGPLATPLSSSMKQKQRTPLPVYKITPNAANRLITPPKRGYGFSYSTYGSPSSTTGTPSGLSNSLLGGSGSNSLRGSVSGSIGRSFSKSYSTSNLRKTFDPESDSVLSPGALQTGSTRGNSGLKRLTIDRGLRNDLFSNPAARNSPAPLLTNGEDVGQSGDKLKKKVSFDSASSGANGGELVRAEPQSPEPSAEELGFLRSIRKSGSLNGVDAAATTDRPEMESVRRDLTVVPENGPATTNGATVKRLTFIPGGDPKPGEYWMQPSRAELGKMGRDQLKQVVDFTVGRQNCGSVTFNGPVDLTNIDLDNLFSTIVDIGLRKITVYPDESIKPPMGKGLNVPSTLRIENSWPRGRDRKSNSPVTSGPLFDKHIDRLQKVGDTEFVNYETETGTWIFKVPHFTTYGLDYDEEEDESHDQSTMSATAPDHPTPKAHFDQSVSFDQSTTFSIDESFVGSQMGVDDDTFDFKKRNLIPGSVPGSFSGQPMPAADEYFSEGETEESFLEEGSTGSTTENDDDVVTESQVSGDSVVGSDEADEMDMAGAFPTPHRTVEHEDYQSTNGDLETSHPISKHFGSPAKPQLDLSGDWAEQLQRTISPRKQNRDALREMQANAFIDRNLVNDESPTNVATASPKKGFSNSIDLMNSLFQQPRKQAPPSLKASKSQPKGPEVRAPVLLLH
jgi:nuclear pore complex protein Nup98-Nup96